MHIYPFCNEVTCNILIACLFVQCVVGMCSKTVTCTYPYCNEVICDILITIFFSFSLFVQCVVRMCCRAVKCAYPYSTVMK